MLIGRNQSLWASCSGLIWNPATEEESRSSLNQNQNTHLYSILSPFFTFLPTQTNKTSLTHHLLKTRILNAWEIVIFISYRPYLGHSFLPAEQLDNVPFSQINKTFMWLDKYFCFPSDLEVTPVLKWWWKIRGVMHCMYLSPGLPEIFPGTLKTRIHCDRGKQRGVCLHAFAYLVQTFSLIAIECNHKSWACASLWSMALCRMLARAEYPWTGGWGGEVVAAMEVTVKNWDPGLQKSLLLRSCTWYGCQAQPVPRQKKKKCRKAK